jgi:hypothetical protein
MLRSLVRCHAQAAPNMHIFSACRQTKNGGKRSWWLLDFSEEGSRVAGLQQRGAGEGLRRTLFISRSISARSLCAGR